jgi:trimethylamine--corrinoid protein Co-methyltransferase
VDRATRRVRLDPGLVEETIATAPAEFTLHARNPQRDVVLGGRHLVFSSVGGPAFVTDLDRGRRAGNWADFQDYVRLISAVNVIHQEAGGPLEPTDLPVETRHLDMYAFLATTLDKTWHCLGFGSAVVEDALEVAARARGVSRDLLLAEPSLITIINTNSPLRLDGPMGDGLIAMAEAGQAVVATPFTLAGAMTPVTLAAAIAQQNAEARSPRTSTCGPARPRSGRRSTSRARSPPARWRGATACRGARRTRPRPWSSTPRRPTSPRWRSGAR